jgi:DNA repair exonuclease SbcCD ATPase subunit
MKHENPYIKVTWHDTPEAFTPEKMKRVKNYFKEKYNTRFIKVITKIQTTNNNNKLKSLEISESILDPNYQKLLMNDFIKQNNIVTHGDMIDRLDNKVNETIFAQDETIIKYNRWYIKNVEFSNFLSFGENNKIDFENLDGITVVESNPRNFGGKSTSTVDLLMFLFFNSTTKTNKSEEIFNRFTDKNRVHVKGVITIDGEDYVIEREVTRKLGRSEKYTVKNDLQFHKILEDGTYKNLSGEQRKETEKFIVKAIGTKKDFLSTILTTGYNLEELIDTKPTERGQILTKFIGLEALKEKERVCREMKNTYERKMLSNTKDKFTLENQIETYYDQIKIKDGEISKKKKDLTDATKKLKDLEEKKEKILSEKHTDVDQTLVKTNPTTIKSEIKDCDEKIKRLNKTLKETVVKEPKDYYLEEKHDSIKDLLRDLSFKVKEDTHNIKKCEDQIHQLTEGSTCPTCKRPLEGVDHTKEINSKKLEIKDFEKTIDKTNKTIEITTEEEVKFSTLKKEYETYEKNKLINTRYELEIRQIEMDKKDKKNKLEFFEANKKKHERNIQIDKDLIVLRTQIDTASSDIKQSNILVERYKNDIKNFNEKIDINKKLIKEILVEEKVLETYKVYLTVFGKNGISKTILRDMIPFLNNELSHLLDDSCMFKLEIKINSSNELDFIMIDTDTRVVKPLYAGSGYERTIASLALRSVLTKVSSLPKPNIVVMDEVFGKIADENLEMVGEFFIKIKEYFEHILVISHNPLIRTWSDNLLMIEKNENISSIQSINTKI